VAVEGEGGGAQVPPSGWYPSDDTGSPRQRPVAVGPMNLGELLDGAVRLFAATWQPMLLVVAVAIVPVQILVGWLQRDAFSDGFFRLLTDPAALEAAASQGPVDSAQLGGVAIAAVVGTLVLPVVAGAVCALTAAAYTGRPLTGRAALGIAGARFWALIGASILVHLVMVLPVLPGALVVAVATAAGTLALGAAGVLLLLGGVFAAVALGALYTAVAPAMVVEGIGVLAAMRRSWHLRRPRLWPTIVAVLVAAFLAGVVGQVITTIPGVLALGFGGQYAWVTVAASGIVAQLIEVPFLTIVSTLLYFDGRIRREGFDLEVLARELSA
jgi:hypothetical protein